MRVKMDDEGGETSEVTGAQNGYGYKYEDELVLYRIPVRIQNV